MLSKEASGQFINFTVSTPLSEGEARKRLIEDGWQPDPRNTHLVRGSRLWTRLWGAYLVPRRKWPMIAEILGGEQGAAVRVRDSFGRMWAWSVPDQDGQVAGGSAGRMASGLDAATSGARAMEKDLTRLLSDGG
ncbi:hypothetical protein [Ornithinimicrobium cryptoxanthini]|uniref:Uncharacterized protein n=1 Tax=Ornithinimicrobium cryptoxanthini TaxID=2934161 RepID=A0ABY4YM93_9MICO|nr:hypothetical protein [Ornithinimicrobium cryptoxanthini]USQ77717.1 hypothetical protein NF557_07415 [Ornithinimicrobium cryptoxanthini]